MSYVLCKVLGPAPVVGADMMQYEPGETAILDDTKTNVPILNGIAWEIVETLPADWRLGDPLPGAAGEAATTGSQSGETAASTGTQSGEDAKTRKAR